MKLEVKAEWAEREERVERRVTRNPNPNPKGGFWFDPGSNGRSCGCGREGKVKLELKAERLGREKRAGRGVTR